MCGISGLISTEIKDDNIIKVMCDEMSHRGPDDDGFWIDPSQKIALGHRRLSIIDLSPEGHQPMKSVSGRYIIVFNGEIYNFKDLKRQVIQDGFPDQWRGHSDTEVLLACIEIWGVEATLKKTNGMFALALYDQEMCQLHLARDRMGEKPLYYGKIGDTFYFCSEIKSIKAACQQPLDINRDVLALYMRHGYIPAPWSIYKEIYKLQPAHWMTIAIDEIKDLSISPAMTNPYWSIRNIAENAVINENLSDEDAITEAEARLKEAVKIRMMSDVPLGAFLSGGYDSSLVVALMQSQSETPIKTFSIGFDTKEYNEAVHAKAVANHLGTDHTELYVTPEQAMAVIPKLPYIYCEPFADSSQIPTYLVSELAKTKVTVALSGDAGDELFGGYNRYFWGERIWNQLSKHPIWMRRLFKKAVQLGSPSAWNKILSALFIAFPKRYHVRIPGDKLYKLIELADATSIDDLYYQLVSGIKAPTDWLTTSAEAKSPLTDPKQKPKLIHPIDRMMFLDMISYLPDDILTKVDRASMAVSLEARVPFLDHEIVEYAWQLPQRLKIRDGHGKWILKQITHKHIPKELMERPKMGFGVPIDQWLRGPLKEWAENLLDAKTIQKQGLLKADYVHKKWQEHLSGKRNWSHQLWTVLMFQAWVEKNSLEDNKNG